MKKRILTLCICFMGMISLINAQTCDCLPLLEDTITKVEKQLQIQSKNISIEKLEYLKWLSTFKTLAREPHSKEDCHALIEDCLNILENEPWVHQFNFRKGKIT